MLSLRRDGLLRGACHRARIRATRWLAMTAQHLNCLCCLKLECRHCEERSDEAIHALFAARWIASRSLSSGAHSRDPLARNDGSTPELSLLFEIRVPSLRGAKRRSNPCSLCGEMDCFASLAMTAQRLNCLCCLKLECRHCEERSDEAIHLFYAAATPSMIRQS